MAVMTHALDQPREVQLHHVPAHTADQFNQLMDQAEQAISIFEIRPLHAQAAQLIGLQLPESREIVRCNCQGCYCDRVVDANTVTTYMDGSVEFVQCEVCRDEHEITGD